MAFTGTPVATAKGKDIVRITGAELALSASGTITASGGAGDVTLPATFPALDEDATICIAQQAADPGGGTPALTVAKTGTPFDTITVKNVDGANATGVLEIYVMNLPSRA